MGAQPEGGAGKGNFFFGNSFRNKCGCANRKSGAVTDEVRPRPYISCCERRGKPAAPFLYHHALRTAHQEDFRALPQGANHDRRVRAPGTAAPRFMSPLVLPPNMKVSISSSDEPRCAWRAAGALFCRAAEVCLPSLMRWRTRYTNQAAPPHWRLRSSTGTFGPIPRAADRCAPHDGQGR